MHAFSGCTSIPLGLRLFPIYDLRFPIEKRTTELEHPDRFLIEIYSKASAK